MGKRSKWKVPYINSIFFQKNIKKKKQILLKVRNSIIPANFVGKVLKIYNGTWHSAYTVDSLKCGFKLGDFSFTRRIGTQKHLKEKRRKKGSKHDKK